MRGFLAVLALAMAACGGSNPLTATVVAETPLMLTIADGDTGNPVPGAPVEVLGSGAFFADALGRVPVSWTDGTVLTVEKDGFIERETVAVGRYQLPLTLAPLRGNATREFYGEMLYDVGPSAPHGRALARIPNGARVAVLYPRFPNDPGRDHLALSACEKAMELLNDALREESSVVFQCAEAASEGTIAVSISADPKDKVFADGRAGGYASPKRHGYVVTGGKIVFVSEGYFFNFRTIAHEMAHILGVYHHKNPSTGMMPIGSGVYEASDFSPEEKLVMRILLQRLPGTGFPDNDRNTALFSIMKAAPDETPSECIVCTF